MADNRRRGYHGATALKAVRIATMFICWQRYCALGSSGSNWPYLANRHGLAKCLYLACKKQIVFQGAISLVKNAGKQDFASNWITHGGILIVG